VVRRENLACGCVADAGFGMAARRGLDKREGETKSCGGEGKQERKIVMYDSRDSFRGGGGTIRSGGSLGVKIGGWGGRGGRRRGIACGAPGQKKTGTS